MICHVSKEELSSFLELHHLGALKYVKLIARGIESATFSLITELDSFILTLFEDETTDLVFMQKTSHFFTTHGFPFTKILAIGTLSNKPAMISSLLFGKGKNEWLAEDYETVGFLLGNLHKCAEGLQGQSITPPFIWQLSNNFFEIQHLIPKEFYKLEQDIFFLEESWPFHLPKGIIHGDLWHKNILFLNDEVSGVLEFHPSYEPLILDLANLIKGIPNNTLVETFLSAYKLARPLSYDEDHYLNLFVYAKLVATTLYLLKKSLTNPSRKDEFQTYAFLNLLKMDSLIYANPV